MKKKKKPVASFQTLQIGRRIRIYVHPQLPFNPHRISFLALCTHLKKIRAFLADSFFCRGFHDSLPDSFMFVRQCHGHCFILLLYIDDRILTRNDFSLLFLFVKELTLLIVSLVYLNIILQAALLKYLHHYFVIFLYDFLYGVLKFYSNL